MFVQLIILSIVPVQIAQSNNTDVVEEPPQDVQVRDDVAELKLQMREEHLNIREEMYSMLGAHLKKTLLISEHLHRNSKGARQRSAALSTADVGTNTSYRVLQNNNSRET